MLSWIIIIAATVVIDQVTKVFATEFLMGKPPFELIPGIFRFTYVENRGAAFGMLSDNRWVFMIISTIAIVALLIYLWKFPPESRLACVALAMIIGGGIGNMIDRVVLGYVVDFLDFCAFPNLWMWVFNMADAFVCVGAGLMILWLVLSMIEDNKQKKQAASENGEAPDDTQDKE